MALDWTKIYKKYKGMWVALAPDEVTVVGSGKTLKEAITKAEKKGFMQPIVNRMPVTLTSYVGFL